MLASQDMCIGELKIYEVNTSRKRHPRSQLDLKAQKALSYTNIDGQPLVEVTRTDKGNGKKSFYQSHWNGKAWVKGLNEQVKSQIHLYRIQDPINQNAIATGQPVLIVEGEGIVDQLLGMGIAVTTSIGGAGKWKLYGYPNYLEDLAGANVVLCPDRDTKGVKHCEEIALDFPNAKWLYAFPDSTLWERVPDNGGVDIVDWIADYKLTHEEILGAIGDKRQDVYESAELTLQSNVIKSQEQKKVRLAVKYEQVEAAIGSNLKLNTLAKVVELAGEAKTTEQIQIELALKYNIGLHDHEANKIIPTLAEKNSYSPAADYLERVYTVYGANKDLLDQAAQRYLGTEKAFDGLVLKRFLISVVARVKQPGCKVDTCLILQGEQGTLKSSFFYELLPEPSWFDDSLGKDTANRDELAKLHRCVLMEWGEIEKAFSKKQTAAIKHFLTQKVDKPRFAYRRDLLELPRASVIVGTTNKEEFLTDETGDRRFWIVKPKCIDLPKLRQERDRLWAAATADYKSGERWWLTKEEERTANQNNEQYRETHPWQPLVEEYLATAEETGEIVTSTNVLAKIKPEVDKRTKIDQMEVTAIMRKLGWTKGEQTRIGDKRVYPWHKSIFDSTSG